LGKARALTDDKTFGASDHDAGSKTLEPASSF